MKRNLSNSGGAFLVTALIFVFVFGAAETIKSQTQQGQPATAQDVKIRQKMTMAGTDRGTETVIYVKGPRMRNEMTGTGMSIMTVRQCDLNRTIMINDKTRTYFIAPDSSGDGMGEGAGIGSGNAAAPQQTQPRGGGVVNITNTITDTGERKEMFGFTARRIKTSMVKEASPDACNQGNNKIETDGWYIDFSYEFSCPTDRKKIDTPGVTPRPDCNDEIRTKTIGKAKLGYPVITTTTMYGPDGKVVSTMTSEVMELSRSPLDAALFDVPAGYGLAKNYQELYGMGAADGGSTPARAGNPSVASTVVAATNAISTAANTRPGFVAAGSPKKEGVSRIGIVMPKAQMTAGESAPAGEALRGTFASYLNGPNIELVALNSRLPSQVIEEAKQSNCDYVLYASLTQKKGGGGMFGKALGNIATSAVGHLPGGSNAGEAAARSVAVTSVYTAADVSASIKSKDELTLEYRLESTDPAKPGVSNIAKAKAKSDGEDVFTPLVEKAAQAIVDAMRSR